MRKPFVGVALALTVVLSGPLLAATLSDVRVARATEAPTPEFCPATVGEMGITYESGLQGGAKPDRVNCSYQKLRPGQPGFSLAMGVKLVHLGTEVPSHDAGYCWADRGEMPDELVSEAIPESNVAPVYGVFLVADRAVQGWYQPSHASLAPQARAAVEILTTALAPRAAICPGAESAELGEGLVDVACPVPGITAAVSASTDIREASRHPGLTTTLLTGSAAQAALDAGLGEPITLTGEDRYGIVIGDDSRIISQQFLGDTGIVEDIIAGESGGESYVLVTIDFDAADPGDASELASHEPDEVPDAGVVGQEPGAASDASDGETGTATKVRCVRPVDDAAAPGLVDAAMPGTAATVGQSPTPLLPGAGDQTGAADEDLGSMVAQSDAVEAFLAQLEASLPPDLHKALAGGDGTLSPKLRFGLGVLDGLVQGVRNEATPEGQVDWLIPAGLISDLVRSLDDSGDIKGIRFKKGAITLDPRRSPSGVDIKAAVGMKTGKLRLEIPAVDRAVIKNLARLARKKVDLDGTLELAERLINHRIRAHRLRLESVKIGPNGITVRARAESLPSDSFEAGAIAREAIRGFDCADEAYAVEHAVECPNG